MFAVKEINSGVCWNDVVLLRTWFILHRAMMSANETKNEDIIQ